MRALLGDAAVDQVRPALSALPADFVKHGFSSADTYSVSSQHVQAYFDVADQIATYVSADSARLGALDACLGQATITDACAQGFIASFGRRAYRRPLRDQEKSTLFQTFVDGKAITAADGPRFLLMELLQSPHFIYRVETEGTEIGTAGDRRILSLTPYELASRLSFLVWGAGPDVALLDDAEAHRLDDAAGLDATLDRLYRDPRASLQTRRFFDEWLETDHLPALDFDATFLAGIATAGLADVIRAETLAFASFHADGGGTFKDLMTSPVAFVKDANLAKVYGLPAPGVGDGKVSLPGTERSGLLTRAGVLAGPTRDTSPIRRGVMVLEKLLCREVPPPPPAISALATPPPYDPNAPARARWTTKTSQSMCAVCHGAINGFGFALENYDPLGRFRTSEPIYDPMDATKIVNQLPIDSAVDIVIDGQMKRVAGTLGLTDALGASTEARTCFARKWFRFVKGRDDGSADASDVRVMVDSESQAGLRALFRQIARVQSFRQKVVEP